MRKSHAIRIEPAADWQMPLSPQRYDRRPTLTQAEREALAEVVPLRPGRRFLQPEQPSLQVLARLTQPLQDIYDLKGCDPEGRTPYLRWMYQQMLQANKPFWAWSKEEWLKATSGANSTRRGIMVMMRVAAYLWCGLLIIDDHYLPFHLARIVFGITKIAQEYEKMAAVIFATDGFGYVRSTGQQTGLRTTLVLALLVNRNPHIDALTVDCLRATKQLVVDQDYQDTLRRITRALVSLKIVRDTALTDVFGRSAEPSVWWGYMETDVDPSWLAWVQAYAAQTTRGVEKYQKGEFYRLIIAGRWRKQVPSNYRLA